MRNQEDDKGELAVYEVSYLILPSIPEDKLTDVVGSIKKVITKEDGKEIDAETPFKQPLAYSMSKTIGASRYVISDAYLGWIKFEAEPVRALEIKAGIEKIAEVLRFLLVKAPRETTFTFAKARAVIKEKVEKKEKEESTSGAVEGVVVE